MRDEVGLEDGGPLWVFKKWSHQDLVTDWIRGMMKGKHLGWCHGFCLDNWMRKKSKSD